MERFLTGAGVTSWPQQDGNVSDRETILRIDFFVPQSSRCSCGALWYRLVGSTLAFRAIGHGFESEHRLFSHNSASAFSKLRSLAKCSLDDPVSRLL